MKTPILSFVLFMLMCMGISMQASAQVTFTSKPGGGKWSDPTTWQVTGSRASQDIPTNPATLRAQDTPNEIIVINSAVVLDQDYMVAGKDAMLTIGSSGSLIEDQPGRTISFGSQQGADMMRLITNGPLRVSSLSFYKADADINAPLQASCSITIANQSTLNIDSSLRIDGNLIVMQGNSSVANDGGNLDGSGQVAISGCVMTVGNGKGLVKDLFDAGLQVCIKGESSDCGLGDIKNLECNPYAMEFVTANGCSSPLPVQLVSFTARNQGGKVQLNWATATELNSASFDVERSVDGKSFQKVVTVKAAGNSSSTHNYTAIDAAPQQGTAYYRLRQVDHDGTMAYSQVVTVQVNRSLAQQEMNVYGSSSLINVDMQTEGVCQSIRVLDAMGRVLRSEQLPAGQTGAFNHQVALGQQARGGVYIVQAVTNQGTISRRVMLQE